MAYNKQEYAQHTDAQRRELNQIVLNTAQTFRDSPEKLIEAIEFQSKFYKYSFGNSILIQLQNPDAEFCNSFKAYKDMGYSILKGEHGMKILVPVYKNFIEIEPDRWLPLSDATNKQKADYKNGILNGRKKLFFKVGTVFDIKQTNCPKSDYPQIFDLGYSSEQHRELFEILKSFSENELGCSVFEDDFGSVQLRGLYDTKANEIHLSSMFDDTTKLSILSHELGHAMLHSNGESGIVPTSQKEFEADAVSIMLHKRFGIEISESRKSHIADHYQKLLKDGYTSEQIINSLNHSNEAYRRVISVIESEPLTQVNEQIQSQQTEQILPNQIPNMSGMAISM